MTGNSIGDQIGKFEAPTRDLQDQNLPDYSLRQLSANAFGEISLSQLTDLKAKPKPFNFKFEASSFAFLFASFLSDLFDLMIIFRLIQSIAITPPQEHPGGVLPAMIGLPAIVASFLGVILTSEKGARPVLSTLCFYRAALVAALLVAGNFFSLSGLVLPIFISALSALIGVSVVARITLSMALRKSTLVRYFSYPLMMAATYLAATSAFENLSSLLIFRWSIFIWLLAALLFSNRLFREEHSDPINKDEGQDQHFESVNYRAYKNEILFKRSAPVLFCLLFIRYGAVIFWACLCLFGCENFQGDSRLFLNSLSFALGGVTLGSLARFIFVRWMAFVPKGLNAIVIGAQIGKLVLLGMAPVCFAFLGQASMSMPFIFGYSALSTFFMTAGITKKRIAREVLPTFLRLEKLAGWSEALIVASVVVLAVLLEPRLDSVSNTAQIRMLALASGAIYIASWATLALLKVSRARERGDGAS